MTDFEKGVKVFAITLAIIIIVTIFSMMLGVLEFAGYIIDGSHHHGSTNVEEYYPLKSSNDNKNKDESNDSSNKIDNVTKLEIELHATNLEIREGVEFKIEKYDEKNNIYFTNQKGTLKIKERDKYFWDSGLKNSIVVYVPKEHTISKVDIEIGAGKATIEGLSVDIFNIEQGAGSLLIDNCSFNNTEIDGGAGKITVKNSTLRNLELDSGVGSVDIEAYILGSSKIDADVGSLKIVLLGSRDDYSISAKKGVGSLRIDGESNLTSYGNGPNYIKVEGGVGSINIDFDN